MILRECEGYRPITINIFFDSGGLGDNIARAPAIRALLTEQQHVSVVLYAPKYIHELYEVWFKSEIDLGRLTLQDIHKATDTTERPSIWFKGSKVTSLGCHLVDHAFAHILNRVPTEDEQEYLTLFSEKPTNKNVILTPGFTSPTRELPAHVWNGMAKWLLQKGYTPVWLGKREVSTNLTGEFREELDLSLGINLLDKTSLLEAAALMSEATLVVGLDNGLIHLAGCTEVPILAGYSTQDPDNRVPIRSYPENTYALTPDSGCSGCEAKLRFVEHHDFRRCYFGDLQCIKGLPLEMWTDALSKILGVN